MTGTEALQEAEKRGLDAIVLSGSDGSCPTCLLTSQLDSVLQERERKLHAKRMGLQNKHLGLTSSSRGAANDNSINSHTRRVKTDSDSELDGKERDTREGQSVTSEMLLEADQGVDEGRRPGKEEVAEFAFDPSRKIKTVRVSCVADERDMLRSAMTARKYLSNGHRVEIHFVAQQQKKGGTRVRKSHLVLLLERFVRECGDVGRPVSLPLSASLLETQAVIKVQIWPCTKEQAAAFQLPRIVLDTAKGDGGKKKSTLFRMGEEKRQAKVAECRRERALLKSTRRRTEDEEHID
ncbi:translation initiation factor if [Cystoisospora suis]|uniref:Translation initiation factor if n=1 Tax=Cystoisospora suis TaxID=483139 RepID=A0A2C6KKT9_9APIC|nr:translation initiation factor if [Cystoisospora suis]